MRTEEPLDLGTSESARAQAWKWTQAQGSLPCEAQASEVWAPPEAKANAERAALSPDSHSVLSSAEDAHAGDRSALGRAPAPSPRADL